MQRIYKILTSLLGESKQGSYDKTVTQYQFNCPHCAEEKGYIDNKYNLEISFSLGKFHCWACGIAGPISSLIKARGGQELYNEYFKVINDIKESKYYNLDLFKDNGDIFTETYLKLPKTFRKIDLNGKIDKQLKEYLEKRKISQDIIDFYNIGRTTWEEDKYAWRNRIIFPSYNSAGDLNYYVGRTYKSNDKRIKYRNCEEINKSDIIFHEDKIQWDADIFLVEGAIDSIYYPNTISLLGKYLTPKMHLFNVLKERAKGKIIICLDGDTKPEETIYIYSLLNTDRLQGKIYYLQLGTDEFPWKDFGEIYESGGKEQLIEVMKSMKQYKTIELTRDLSKKKRYKNE